MGRYYRIPADLAYPLPDNLTFEDGALVGQSYPLSTRTLTAVLQMEPLSVAVHALANIGKVHANQTVAVFGAGMFTAHYT